MFVLFVIALIPCLFSGQTECLELGALVDNGLSASSFHRTLQEGVTANPFIDGVDPVWWNTYRSKYGKRAKRCIDQPVLPENGSSCPRKRAGEYSCFFGDQTCPTDGSAHPEYKCDCLNDGQWLCSRYQPCGDSVQPPFTTCPERHPLTFNYKLTCQSDFLVCNYGIQFCCGEQFPTATCECIDGEFTCFNHETCRYRQCSETCPEGEPGIGEKCFQASPRETCAYNRVSCCGVTYDTKVWQCFNQEWDTVTDILVDCDCPKSGAPTIQPVVALPTAVPTTQPEPSSLPSSLPSQVPSMEPPKSPSEGPSSVPTVPPSTLRPSSSITPTIFPSTSLNPSKAPSVSTVPSFSSGPSSLPSRQPTPRPTSAPTKSLPPITNPQTLAPSPPPTPEPTIPPFSCSGDISRLLVNEDFNSIDVVPLGWSQNAILSKDTLEQFPTFTQFLGRFGNTTVTKTFRVPSGVVSLEISFDFYEIDSWDNSVEYGSDRFMVSVNGNTIDFGPFAANVDEGDRNGVSDTGGIVWTMISLSVPDRNYGFNPLYFDQRHRITLIVPGGVFQQAATNDVVLLGFVFMTNSPIQDEAGGIDNLSVTGTVPCAQCAPEEVWIREDFEEPGSTDPWFRGKTDSGGDLSTFLGRYFQGQFTERTFEVPIYAQQLRLEFDFYEIDSWDDEVLAEFDFFRPTIDGDLLNLGPFGSETDEGNRSGRTRRGITWTLTSTTEPTQLAFNPTFKDQKHHITAYIPRGFALDGAITVKFEFLTNQAVTDESGGIDNIQLTAVFGDCIGQPTLAPNFSLDPHAPPMAPTSPTPTTVVPTTVLPTTVAPTTLLPSSSPSRSPVSPSPSRPPTPSPTFPPVQCTGDIARLIVKEDFEDTTAAEDWTNGRIDQSQYFSKFLGRYSNETVSKSFMVPRYAETVFISFDFFELDSWDNSVEYGSDRFFVGIDGTTIDLGPFAANIDEGTRNGVVTNSMSDTVTWRLTSIDTPAHYGFNPLYFDQSHRVTLIVSEGFFQNDGDVKIDFTFLTNSPGIEDESGGIDNLQFVAEFPCTECRPEELLFEDDFETNGTLPLWFQGRLDSGGDFTQFLGRYVQDQFASRTYRVPFYATQIRIQFDFYEITRWDSTAADGFDFFIPAIDGEILNLGPFGGSIDEGNRSGRTRGGVTWTMVSLTQPSQSVFNPNYADQIHRITAYVPPVLIVDGKLDVRFEFRTNKDNLDESGGVDNIRVIASFGDCVGFPTTSPSIHPALAPTKTPTSGPTQLLPP